MVKKTAKIWDPAPHLKYSYFDDKKKPKTESIKFKWTPSKMVHRCCFFFRFILFCAVCTLYSHVSSL